ncbi:DUF3027 domain-containing protein [Canibacter sp. lx-45]|uniref:DUF3027 domain-containing protein n=1 Tax=Canibacter zhuwentaonis TaxID=2837491 RepID=UPI001BDBEBD8|nr:DUF3027 domain-containing protein [Canibacter zhuwentaonis]MBT1035804.1 DUF3027 domain-containing protein [Canibacter zhuwentaonis]
MYKDIHEKALRKRAKEELLKVAEPTEIGRLVSVQEESEHSLTFLFKCKREAYTGWNWVITLTQLDPAEPVTVTELSLLTGRESLVAPEWVSWDEQLRQYKETVKQVAQLKLENTDGESGENAAVESAPNSSD